MPETTSYSAVMAAHTLQPCGARVSGLGIEMDFTLIPQNAMTSLDLPASWKLVAYFCIGYPAAESDRPELERLGWEQRRPAESRILQR